MQRKAGGFPVDVGVEGDLGVDDLQKILTLALRKYLEAGLARCLNEQAIALARDT
jgi:hypothetical protein